MEGAEPTISGRPKVGQRVTGTVTDWLPLGSSLTFAWFAGDTLLQSGTTRSLVVPPAAAGKTILLRVTETRSGYEPLTRESARTAEVAPGALTVSSPRVIGAARIGNTLTVSSGYWGPPGVRLGHRWKVGKRLVPGPKGRRTSFRIPRSARGKRISVIVTGTLAGYATVRRSSAPTSKVVR